MPNGSKRQARGVAPAEKPERSSRVFVAASSRCFPDLPLDAALLQLVDLEYSSVEIMIHETGGI